MKGYKAFGSGMVCRGKQYAENTIFEETGAEICRKGMHFCKNPLDVLEYYPLVNYNGEITEFAEVEALDEAYTNDDKKYCTKKLKVGAKIDFTKLVQASVNFEFKKKSNVKTTSENYAKIGSSGYAAQIGSSGYAAQIGSSGDFTQIGSSGNYAQIGSSGDFTQIGSSGDFTQIGSSGNSAKIGSSGNSAKIGSSGNYAQIESKGKNSVICCAGHNSKVKAKKGSWITLSEWKHISQEWFPVCVKTEKVDGKIIKEDTFYILKNGEFTEAEE